MKKLLIASVLFLILISGAKNDYDFTLLDYFSGQYKSYASTQTEGATNLGFCYMSNNIQNKKMIIGESIKISNFEPVSALSCLEAKLVKTEVLEDGTTVLYGYTKLIKETVTIEGELVNLQIACVDDYCIVGWPLILGSF